MQAKNAFVKSFFCSAPKYVSNIVRASMEIKSSWLRPLGNLKTRRRGFFPKKNPHGRASNFKRNFNIYPDGTITDGIFLFLADERLREQIILFHYLAFMTQKIVREEIGFNLVSRDAPWDFGLETSRGTCLNIEITSIADNSFQLEVNKREAVFQKLSEQKLIEKHQLKKIMKWFPVEDAGSTTSDLPRERVKNPYYPPLETQLFISAGILPALTIAEIIGEAVQRKNSKAALREKAVLLLDNRTSEFSPMDVKNQLPQLQDSVDKAIFEEVWLYTGYYSDLNGNNAECSFIPLKLPELIAPKFSIGKLYHFEVPNSS